MGSRDAEFVHQLFLLNITLQAFDGAATYFGIRHPWYEANPIVGAVMGQIGIGTALLLLKGGACAALVLLRSMAGQPIATRALTVVAIAYTCLSFIPWTAKNIMLL